MVLKVNKGLLKVVIMLISTYCISCTAIISDTLSSGQAIAPNQTIVSEGGRFKLGFFSPGSSNRSYIGIWYRNSPETVVWVANRQTPITGILSFDSELKLSNGNLYIYDGLRRIVWSTILHEDSKVTRAVLLDNGNFVLRDNKSEIKWQSFEYPTDTWLPGARIGFDGVKNFSLSLISWKNRDDPAPGVFSFEIDAMVTGEFFIRGRGSNIYWRSGPWNGGSFPNILVDEREKRTYNSSYVYTADRKYMTFDVCNQSVLSRIQINSSGMVRRMVWSDDNKKWVVELVLPSQKCQVYALCGAFGICDIHGSTLCGCLPGFVPRIPSDWALGDFSAGCVREEPLDCGRGREGARFVKMLNVRLPAYFKSLLVGRAEICEFACSINCSCFAYAYSGSQDCLLWTGELLDLEQLDGTAGGDLYIKISAHKRLGGSTVVALATSISFAALFCFILAVYLMRRMRKQKGTMQHSQNLLLLNLSSGGGKDNQEKSTRSSTTKNNYKGYELPMFSFSSIAAATDNFSINNKLGEGGFGPVYKGELHNGQLVAVKRLSRKSGQGLEEFKNETELIANLQHRNLVRILGCCLEQEEMILIYEYMPNNSLDSFLFEPTKQWKLDWQRRIHIIQGIAQGLLYLHQHSRLKIIHRDLKASNILLDAEMDPKISDFGMARIFGGNKSQANTNRIVGTYGYMSPEYAMDGVFSTKSDVFAFGILLLEIISGKKNTGFYGSGCFSLLRYAWELWQNRTAFELIDPVVQAPSSSISLRYIHVGLLCVQENPADRPSMSDVIAMLINDQMELAAVKQPAFTCGRNDQNAGFDRSNEGISSANNLTISVMEAR